MTLEIPICSFDAKTGLLCPICEAKAKRGEISEADVEVSKALVQLAGRSKDLDSVSLVRSHKVGRDYLLEVNAPALLLLRDNELKSELERSLDGRIWATGSSSSDRQLVEDLVHPFTLTSMSTLWLPDGSKVSKATLVSAGRRLGWRLGTAQKLVKAARGMDLIIDYEPSQYPYRGLHSDGTEEEGTRAVASAA